MKLKIHTRMVYGRPLHYPMCATSKLLVLLGRRATDFCHTFSNADLSLLKLLGFEIEKIPDFEVVS